MNTQEQGFVETKFVTETKVETNICPIDPSELNICDSCA